MKRLTPRQQHLLGLLADGRFHSGEQIGRHLAISRAAVSQQLKGLRELGIEIFSLTGTGYRLSQPLQLLDEGRLNQAVGGAPVHCVAVIDSTNRYLMSRLSEWQRGECLLAECQTAGRGRRGRPWISPFGGQLILSLYWRLDEGMPAAMGLSLVVGVALVEALEACGYPGVRLKWPNDLYLNGRKLAGILVEMSATVGGACHLVVGVGLNLTLPHHSGEQIDQPWTDLASLGGGPIERQALTVAVIRQLRQALTAFEQAGLAPFMPRWNRLDQFRDQRVRLQMGERVQEGIARGIDAQGALQLETAAGLQSIIGGELSLRPAE